MAIINIPAPAGSQLAGQIQMRAMEGLGQALGMYLGQRRAGQLRQEDIRRLQAMSPQQDIFNAMYGAREVPAPQAQMPQMVSPMGQELALRGQLGSLFADPLEREYKRAQIESARALTGRRREEAKQALPDRMLRQADRYLRVVDDIMSEYWYTPEGPYRDKLLKDAQSAREKAIKLIEKYGATSEAGKVSLQQLANIDEEIKRAGGKVSPPKKGIAEFGRIPTEFYEEFLNAPQRKFVVDKYSRPKTKREFDNTLSHISSEDEKDRYYEKWWRPEFSR